MTAASAADPLFDVDGTLVDSQASYRVSSMTAASFDAHVACPYPIASGDLVHRWIVACRIAMARLAPDQSTSVFRRSLVEGYKEAYHAHRLEMGAASSPLYPGVREVIGSLQAVPEILLGVATGKSQRGLDALLEAHGLDSVFVTRQVADHHPSKPHPSMIETALFETGVSAGDAVMIGDTSFDMEMARAAGVAGIGVGWGYHDRSQLGAASAVIDRFEQLPGVLTEVWG